MSEEAIRRAKDKISRLEVDFDMAIEAGQFMEAGEIENLIQAINRKIRGEL